MLSIAAFLAAVSASALGLATVATMLSALSGHSYYLAAQIRNIPGKI